MTYYNVEEVYEKLKEEYIVLSSLEELTPFQQGKIAGRMEVVYRLESIITDKEEGEDNETK